MSVLPSGTTKHPVAGSSASDKLKKNSNSSSISLVSGLVNTSGLTIQSSSTTPSVHKSKTNQQPSISITPLPRSNTTSASTNKPSLSVTPVTAVNSNATASNSNSAPKAGQPTTPGQKGGVVCEICDGSIKVSFTILYLPVYCQKLISNYKKRSIGSRTIKAPHAVDSQSENSSQDDSQSASAKLSKMPVSVFY
jgi:hypothetical protein